MHYHLLNALSLVLHSHNTHKSNKQQQTHKTYFFACVCLCNYSICRQNNNSSILSQSVSQSSSSSSSVNLNIFVFHTPTRHTHTHTSAGVDLRCFVCCASFSCESVCRCVWCALHCIESLHLPVKCFFERCTLHLHREREATPNTHTTHHKHIHTRHFCR